MISEFYQLRRTAIKDIAAYLGFLVGFIGSAPFAWGLLAVQLDAGRFARGLWYFVGIVTTAGIFAGIAGLGVGIATGLLWEQLHRFRRAARAVEHPALPGPDATSLSGTVTSGDAPKLQLVTSDPPSLPNLAGRRLTAVRFSATSVEIDFGGFRVTARNNLSVARGGVRCAYPDAEWRDVLVNSIGARAEQVRITATNRIEVELDNGCALMFPQVATEGGESPRQAHESPA